VVGVMHWRAAKQLGLTEVDCRVVGPNDVAGAILADLVLRPHYTQSAIAYLAYPLLATAVAESKVRRIENLKERPMFPR